MAAQATPAVAAPAVFPEAAAGASSGAINVVTRTPVAVSNPVSVSTPVTQSNGNFQSGGLGTAALPIGGDDDHDNPIEAVFGLFGDLLGFGRR